MDCFLHKIYNIFSRACDIPERQLVGFHNYRHSCKILKQARLAFIVTRPVPEASVRESRAPSNLRVRRRCRKEHSAARCGGWGARLVHGLKSNGQSTRLLGRGDLLAAIVASGERGCAVFSAGPRTILPTLVLGSCLNSGTLGN